MLEHYMGLMLDVWAADLLERLDALAFERVMLRGGVKTGPKVDEAHAEPVAAGDCRCFG
jgi:hypothetical protein